MSDVINAIKTFGEFASDMRKESLSENVHRAATFVLLDTVGAVLAGAMAPEVAAMREYLRDMSPGSGATAIAPGLPAMEVAWATFLNATAGTVNELDEYHPPSGHPAVHVAPAVLALGEYLHASGDHVLTATVIGYELAAKLAMCVQFRHGFHPHGPLGAIAAGLACGHLFGFTKEQFRTVMGAAASLIPVTAYAACHEGTTIRNSYSGEGARLGLTAAVMVKSGFTANPNEVAAALERISNDLDLSRAVPLMNGQYEISRNQFKFHAACGLSIAPLDAVVNAVGDRSLAIDSIASVVLQVTERTLSLAGAHPNSKLGAKFSLPYEVAAFLKYGVSGYDAYDQKLLADEHLAAFERRITLVPVLGLLDGEANAAITLRDGTVIGGRCERPFGRYDNPPSSEALVAKFDQLAGLALSAGQVPILRDQLFRLSDITDIGFVWKTTREAGAGY